MGIQLLQKKAKPVMSSGKKPRGRPYEGQHVNVQSILHANKIQPKLSVGQPNDKYEQEADRVADQVMQMPAPQPGSFSSENNLSLPNSSPFSGAIQRVCIACAKDEALIQAKTMRSVTPEVTPTIGAGIQSLQGGGQSLSKSERDFFEPRFGTDFSNVRVHSDVRAFGLAQSVNARAFTHGRDVVFGAGQYTPGTATGNALLAHELTHVVQQGAHRSSAHSSAAQKIQRTLKETSLENCDFHAYMDIGIFAKPSLYKEPTGLNNPSELINLAAQWEAAINSYWTGPVPCSESTGHCNFMMHATVRAYPEAKYIVQIAETNAVRVREEQLIGNKERRSWARGGRGGWVHSEGDMTIAHEAGHLMGLEDKYFIFGKQRSFRKFTGDAMANFHIDPGEANFGPARARVMAINSQNCPCCDRGMQKKP